MAITHFEILQLPDENALVSTKNAFPLLVDTLYPIAEEGQVNFTKTPEFALRSFLATALWRVYNDVEDIYSEPALLYLSFRRPLEPLPSSVLKTETVLIGDSISVFDTLPISQQVDHIVVTDLIGIIDIKINGQNVYIGQKITLLELFNCVIKTRTEGAGEPYFNLKYSVGKDNELYPLGVPTVYDFFVDVLVSAEIAEIGTRVTDSYLEDFDVPPITSYTVKEESISIELSKGQVNGIANFEIIIDSPFLSLNTWNKIIFYANGVEIEKTANETFNILVALDLDGKAPLGIINYIVENTGVPKIGEITINLIDIDGDVGMVNPALDQLILNTFIDIVLTIDTDIVTIDNNVITIDNG